MSLKMSETQKQVHGPFLVAGIQSDEGVEQMQQCWPSKTFYLVYPEF
jgi:hypothetical protein